MGRDKEDTRVALEEIEVPEERTPENTAVYFSTLFGHR